MLGQLSFREGLVVVFVLLACLPPFFSFPGACLRLRLFRLGLAGAAHRKEIRQVHVESRGVYIKHRQEDGQERWKGPSFLSIQLFPSSPSSLQPTAQSINLFFFKAPDQRRSLTSLSLNQPTVGE